MSSQPSLSRKQWHVELQMVKFYSVWIPGDPEKHTPCQLCLDILKWKEVYDESYMERAFQNGVKMPLGGRTYNRCRLLTGVWTVVISVLWIRATGATTGTRLLITCTLYPDTQDAYQDIITWLLRGNFHFLYILFGIFYWVTHTHTRSFPHKFPLGLLSSQFSCLYQNTNSELFEPVCPKFIS